MLGNFEKACSKNIHGARVIDLCFVVGENDGMLAYKTLIRLEVTDLSMLSISLLLLLLLVPG